MTRAKYFPLLRVLFVISLIVGGLWARSRLPAGIASNSSRQWPWKSARTATLYFTDGSYFVPVSRQIPSGDDAPRAVLQALLAGPGSTTNLTNPIPHGVSIKSVKLANNVVDIDLSAAFRAGDDVQKAEAAIVESMTELPGIDTVALTVEGAPLNGAQKRIALLYYASANGLVATTSDANSPKNALAAYLAGPPEPQLTGLPADVRVLRYDYDPASRLLSLDFTYTPSLHELALEKPERIRMALLGLIASLTQFPGVRAVQLDFEGHTRLGLGQCSDLLRTPQPRPELLNDERLLGR